MGEILNAYLEAKQVEKKRRQIQRRLVFQKPVLGISLDTISSNAVLERTDAQTDETDMLADIPSIRDFEREELEKAGYYRVSDINNRGIRLINREVEIPWNGLKELKDLADKDDDTIPFAINENTEETVSREDAIRRIVNCDTWASMFMYQFALVLWCEKKSSEFLSTVENPSKKVLIDEMIDGTYRPDNYVREISEFVGASENYVKDVISGRIEYGLTDSEREEILERDDNKCRACGSEDDLEVHHIIPINKGGDKQDDNLCTLCSDCHVEVAHGQNMAEVSYDSKKEFWNRVDEVGKNQSG